MSATRLALGWGGRRGAAIRFVAVAIVCFAAVPASRAAEVLFPSPLHITREVSEPISGTKIVIDEYCHGSRVVAVSGTRTAIADYAKGELTSIDFGRGTYSVTTFEVLAAANAPSTSTGQRRQARVAATDSWSVEHRGGAVVASRPGEVFEAERRSESVREVVRVTADRQWRVSRSALEALLGTGYPHAPSDSADVVMRSLRASSPRIGSDAVGASPSDEYHIPLEQVLRYELGGEVVESRNVVVRIGTELPPADVMTIPPGARLVESEAVAGRRLLEELDRLPQSPDSRPNPR